MFQMDDLIAYGTAGIFLLFVIAAMILYGVFVLIMTAGHAVVSGDFDFIFGLVAAAILAFSLYAGTGLWLQKAGWI